jgi:hypothetical protein
MRRLWRETLDDSIPDDLEPVQNACYMYPLMRAGWFAHVCSGLRIGCGDETHPMFVGPSPNTPLFLPALFFTELFTNGRVKQRLHNALPRRSWLSRPSSPVLKDLRGPVRDLRAPVRDARKLWPCAHLCTGASLHNSIRRDGVHRNINSSTA